MSGRGRIALVAEGMPPRQVLNGVRWLLLKNPDNLNDEKDERKRLEEALLFNHVLATAYYLKESLREPF